MGNTGVTAIEASDIAASLARIEQKQDDASRRMDDFTKRVDRLTTNGEALAAHDARITTIEGQVTTLFTQIGQINKVCPGHQAMESQLSNLKRSEDKTDSRLWDMVKGALVGIILLLTGAYITHMVTASTVVK